MNFRRQQTRARGFTMVEIALSIAVVAFALVAILGVLPTGLTVQQDNREDTIINQEGRYWVEAIRSGAHGLADITNHVEEIKVIVGPVTNTFVNAPGNPLTAEQIIGLLSTPLPAYPSITNNTSRVVARVKALTGAAVDAGSLTNQSSFRYELTVYLRPHDIIPYSVIDAVAASAPRQAANLAHQREMVRLNLHDLRLVLKWPLFERGTGWVPGNNRKTFRSQVAGGLTVNTNLPLPGPAQLPVGFLQPNKFQYVPPPVF